MRYLVIAFVFIFSFSSVSYAIEAIYDSLSNINKNNYTQLIGQTLYYPAGEIIVSNLFWSNKGGRIYKPNENKAYNKYSKNEFVLNKHFVIEKIIITPSPLLKTRIKENNEIVFINLNALFNSTPYSCLFVVGYIKKCWDDLSNKRLYIDKIKYKKQLPSSLDTKDPNIASIYCKILRSSNKKGYGGVLYISDMNNSRNPTEIDILDYENSKISKNEAEERIKAAEIKAKEEAERKAKEEAERKQKFIEEYKNKYKWDVIPLTVGEFRSGLHCSLCDESADHYYPRFTYISNDSIFWIGEEIEDLKLTKLSFHCGVLSDELKENPDFKTHLEIYRDSLCYRRPDISEEDYALLNMFADVDYLNRLEKYAPFGYVENYSWEADYNTLSMSLKYTNTNKKTIKYIQTFWETRNEVGDIRDRGSLKGTGPLEQWQSASWDWDNTLYFLAGDVKYLDISKIVITYMDGTTKILPKSKILFNY